MKLKKSTVYGICLLIAVTFFFFWGFNSPLYAFNSDNDFNWFVTMGKGFVAGKIPYRDLFEQKGPLVYFIFAFACLFRNHRLVIWCIEIFTMSWFLFICYRFGRRYLNAWQSLLIIPIMALTIFSAWCRINSAAVVEEFCLPLFAYFFDCFLEYLLSHRQWNMGRSLFLGLTFGTLFWVKYTLLYFALTPMIIWLVTSLKNHDYRNLWRNIFMMLLGFIIITVPILIFFAANHALTDLGYAYFYCNMTKYRATTLLYFLGSFSIFFVIGPLLLGFIVVGVILFAKKHWHEKSGWLLLICFGVNLLLLAYSSKFIAYYYAELVPYSLLGIVYFLQWVNQRNYLQQYPVRNFLVITFLCMMICLPNCILTYEWGRPADDYAPVQVANTINAYRTQTNQEPTLFCYKIWAWGFHNTTDIVPNNYFWVNNIFDEDQFPEMYAEFHASITNQTSDFVITELSTWEREQDFLSQYYAPYTGDVATSTYHHRKAHYFYYRYYDFILLYRV